MWLVLLWYVRGVFWLVRRLWQSTLSSSSAASDVDKGQVLLLVVFQMVLLLKVFQMVLLPKVFQMVLLLMVFQMVVLLQIVFQLRRRGGLRGGRVKNTSCSSQFVLLGIGVPHQK